MSEWGKKALNAVTLSKHTNKPSFPYAKRTEKGWKVFSRSDRVNKKDFFHCSGCLLLVVWYKIRNQCQCHFGQKLTKKLGKWSREGRNFSKPSFYKNESNRTKEGERERKGKNWHLFVYFPACVSLTYIRTNMTWNGTDMASEIRTISSLIFISFLSHPTFLSYHEWVLNIRILIPMHAFAMRAKWMKEKL